MFNLPLLYDYTMGNMILPNALTTEMLFMNLVYSKYNSGYHFYSLFDKEKGQPNSILQKIFGNHYMDWPPVMRDSGCHLSKDCYKPFVNIVEDSVVFGKKRFQKYIYPIILGPHSRLFCAKGLLGDKINGEYLWKNISADVLEDARQGRAVIFFDWAHESLMTRELYCHFHDSLRWAGIRPSNLIFACNSFNASELYNQWFTQEERLLTVINWPFMMFFQSHHHRKFPNTRVSTEQFHNSFSRLREHYFLFKNRRSHRQRCALLYRLHQLGTLSKADWSFLSVPEYDMFKGSILTYNIGWEESHYQDLIKMLPHHLHHEHNIEFNSIHGQSDIDKGSSADIYFEVVTESLFDTNYITATEKIVKPMVNFLPFILLGPPGLLRKLRELGFKTFHPFVNESYDDETNHSLRLEMVANEVYKLCQLSKEQLHQWYWNMKDILEHNNNFMLNFCIKDNHNLELLQHLDELLK